MIRLRHVSQPAFVRLGSSGFYPGVYVYIYIYIYTYIYTHIYMYVYIHIYIYIYIHTYILSCIIAYVVSYQVPIAYLAKDRLSHAGGLGFESQTGGSRVNPFPVSGGRSLHLSRRLAAAILPPPPQRPTAPCGVFLSASARRQGCRRYCSYCCYYDYQTASTTYCFCY